MAGNRKAIVLPMVDICARVTQEGVSRTCSGLCLDKQVCTRKTKLILNDKQRQKFVRTAYLKCCLYMRT